VSWRRTSRASRRSLSDGWGFTAAGAIVAFAGWGVWAAALRGTGSSLFTGLVFMLIVAVGLFALARFLGYLLVHQVLRRPRLHARWAHFLTGLFLTAAGISYLINTTWLADAGDWTRELTDRIGHLWP
jgi:Kef-type K+ transport system membrane component KefB